MSTALQARRHNCRHHSRIRSSGRGQAFCSGPAGRGCQEVSQCSRGSSQEVSSGKSLPSRQACYESITASVGEKKGKSTPSPVIADQLFRAACHHRISKPRNSPVYRLFVISRMSMRITGSPSAWIRCTNISNGSSSSSATIRTEPSGGLPINPVTPPHSRPQTTKNNLFNR